MNLEELSNIITSPDCCPVIAKYIENFSEHMDEESLSVFDEYTAVLSQSKTTKPVEVAEFFALKVIQTTFPAFLRLSGYESQAVFFDDFNGTHTEAGDAVEATGLHEIAAFVSAPRFAVAARASLGSNDNMASIYAAESAAFSGSAMLQFAALNNPPDYTLAFSVLDEALDV